MVSLTEQQKASALVKKFAAKRTLGAFPHLSRSRISNELLDRIQKPWLIKQGQTELCGPAAVVYMIAKTRPLEYASAATRLFDVGKATIGKWKLEPDKDLKNYRLPTSAIVPHADWLVLASIRDSANYFFDFQSRTDDGATRPGEVASWLRAAGYSTVIEEWNRLFNKDWENLKRADRLYGAGHHVCLLVHSDIVHGKITSHMKFNHFVALASPIRFGFGLAKVNVVMTVFTWGKKRLLPLKGTLYLDDFLRNYWGFVSCKY